MKAIFIFFALVSLAAANADIDFKISGDGDASLYGDMRDSEISFSGSGLNFSLTQQAHIGHGDNSAGFFGVEADGSDIRSRMRTPNTDFRTFDGGNLTLRALYQSSKSSVVTGTESFVVNNSTYVSTETTYMLARNLELTAIGNGSAEVKAYGKGANGKFIGFTDFDFAGKFFDIEFSTSFEGNVSRTSTELVE